MFNYYNLNQVVLPLDLEVKLKENDIAYHVHHIVEHIPDEAFKIFFRDSKHKVVTIDDHNNSTKKGSNHPNVMIRTLFCYFD